METLKAFFYDYKYYLFPENCFSLSDIKNQKKLYVRRLKEERCMAPNFTYESIINETLEIEDPNRVFEIEANLYSQQEYDELLDKLIDIHCVNCARYVKDDTPLSESRHYYEMSLSGVCYEREEKDEAWPFGYCVDFFWRRISRKIAELSKYIDKKDQKKLNKVLNAELTHFYYACDFYGVKQNGKYHLYFSVAAGNFLHASIVQFIAAVANSDNSPIKTAGWEVHPFIPEGVKKVKFNIKKFPLGYEFYEDAPGLALKIYHPKAQTLKEDKAYKIVDDIFEYLGAEIGENVVRTIVQGYTFTDIKPNALSFEELKKIIKTRYEEGYVMPNGEKAPFPPPMGYGRNEEDANTDQILPYRQYIREGTTTNGHLSFVDLEELKQKPWWLNVASFIYIYVPRAFDGPENALETLSWYMANTKLIPEPLRDPNRFGLSGMGIGWAECGENGFIIDNMIMDETRFFNAIRPIAPVLRSYNAKMVVVNKGGVISYNCDYVITPTESL